MSLKGFFGHYDLKLLVSYILQLSKENNKKKASDTILRFNLSVVSGSAVALHI